MRASGGLSRANALNIARHTAAERCVYVCVCVCLALACAYILRAQCRKIVYGPCRRGDAFFRVGSLTGARSYYVGPELFFFNQVFGIVEHFLYDLVWIRDYLGY